MIELTAREKDRYSIRRAIETDAARRLGDRGARSFELEISQELGRQLGALASGYEPKGGVLVPTGIAIDGGQAARRARYQERAGLDTKTPTKGQELTFDDPGSFIDYLRPHTWVLQLGATLLTGLKGDVGFPRATAGGVVTWGVENPGIDTAESQLALDQVFLTPRTAQSTTSYSRQLLAQSTPSVDAVVATDLAKANAAALDRAALQGTAPAPLGLFNQLITDAGAVTTYSGAVGMETTLITNNAGRNKMGLAYLADPLLSTVLKTTSQGGGITLPGWYEGQVNNYRAEVSSNMPASSIVLGDWPELLIGEWGVLELITDPYAKKKQGMIEVTSFLLADTEVRHLQSFIRGDATA